ncbi:MAG: carboxypeptidase regulatory-like domain-containing protein [Anaerolineales bacterium]|nr:carboxypeptidase regulatory-like domain-containing protein [Anaerolineales bacterium]
MTSSIKNLGKRSAVVLTAFLLIINTTSCTFSLVDFSFLPDQPGGMPLATTPFPVPPTSTPAPMAEVVFYATVPVPLESGQGLMISILDEVTGLALNPKRYPMEAVDTLTHKASIPIPLDTVVKYRYSLSNSGGAYEATTANQPVRYRLYHATGPGETRDIISNWTNRNFSGDMGSVRGQIKNIETGSPIPNLLVTVGGEQVLTNSKGRFNLEGLVPGTHNMVVYALDGGYQTFQQGATVGRDAATDVTISVRQAPLVNVVFNVSVPINTQAGAPLRLAGNLLQLGNSYSDLAGGLSTIPSQMPVMQAQADGRYTLSLNLPAGADIHYKYTLGDGFWNSEHGANGEFIVRQFIVPQSNAVVQDVVESWQAGSSAPILFDITVPDSTPANDIVYIQFNPYGWTEPIPMWPLGNNRWAYKLYGPLNILNNFGYRYCRNAQCGSADDKATPGDTSQGRSISTKLTGQEIKETVDSWNWMDEDTVSVVGSAVTARQAGFIAGIEFQSEFSPNWMSFTEPTLENVKALGSNWFVVTPTWTFTREAPLAFSPVPGQDQLWNQTYDIIGQARAFNLSVAVFPQLNYPMDSDTWWQASPRDELWWNSWFNQYHDFVINYADMAARSGAQALILGGETLNPALPGGLLANGNPSNAPADSDSRWRVILGDVRAHFNGPVLWAFPYQVGNLQSAPTFLKDTDGIYLLWSVPLSEESNPSKADMTVEAGRLLDEEVALFQSAMSKPVILGLAYPSIKGAASGCILQSNECIHWSELNQPNPDIAALSLDLQGQSDAYEAVLSAVNSRPWVAGVISRGYYPPTMLKDKSASIHGKPAADLLWYWYPRLLGTITGE